MIYLCGPMRGIPYFNAPLFDSEAARLREAGHRVLSPIELDRRHGLVPEDHPTGDVPAEFDTLAALSRDFDMIDLADTLCFIGGRVSGGVAAEIVYARRTGKLVLRRRENV